MAGERDDGRVVEADGGLAVVTRGLTKRYGNRAAVADLGMTVQRGEVYGFLGPNGAGKTTTLRMLVGLIRPTSGSALVVGEEPGSAAELAKVGALIETPSFYPYLSGRDNLRVMARYGEVDDRRVDEVLGMVGLAGRGRDAFKTYSLGMKQRLGIGAALLKDPELLVLDEPTNGLDPQGVVEVRGLIRHLGAEGKTVLLSSHLLSEVEQVSDRVGIIQRGRLVAEGDVDELRVGGGIAVKAEPRAVAMDVLTRIAGAEPVAMGDGTLQVSMPSSEAPRVTRALIEAGAQVLAVQPVERTLEEVFLQLTDEVEA